MKTEIGKSIERAENLLCDGQLIAVPTETVYGLAGNALIPKAVLRIFEVKDRPSFDPLIVHIKGIEEVEKYAAHFDESLLKLAERFWPGPLTLLLPKKHIIPDIVTSGLDTVGLRMPNHPVMSELLNKLDFPLAAPSANPFGYVSPTDAEHVFNSLGGKIPYILDGGPCRVGVESTIVGISDNGEVTIYRAGGVSIEVIEAVVGKAVILPSTDKPSAPGMLRSHYATRTPLYLHGIDQLITKFGKENIGAISLNTYFNGIPEKNQFQLSLTGDLSEAAANLFAVMRKVDDLQLRAVYATLVPEQGIGRAVNDRLRRAAVV